jgi:hypothetical protein
MLTLYVDDFLICYRSSNMRSIERVLQQCLDNLQVVVGRERVSVLEVKNRLYALLPEGTAFTWTQS